METKCSNLMMQRVQKRLLFAIERIIYMAISFGKKMKEIREQNHWSLEDMAKKLDTTKQALSKYERGERTPKVTVAAKFADILGIPLEQLIGLEEAEQTKDEVPKSEEAKILARGIDKLPKAQREQALSMFKLMFAPQYAELFNKGEDDDT